MALSPAQKDALSARVQRRWSRAAAEAGFTKPQLESAIEAVDTWLEDNVSGFSQALPPPFRDSATIEQKALLLVYAVMVKAGLEMEDF